MSDSGRPHRWQPTRLPRPWDSPSENTGVGCHFLLQCRKVKSESEVAQSCLTLHDPTDCSPPGSSVHGIFQARVLEWGAIAFSETYYKHENTFDINLDYLAEAVQFLHYKFTLLFPLSKLNFCQEDAMYSSHLRSGDLRSTFLKGSIFLNY